MALQGTLETFALPDVLRLLASTKKSGVLRVDTDRGNGELFVNDGELSGGAADRLPHVDQPSDVVFELLRSTDGSFVFDAGAPTEDSGTRQDVDTALEVAEQQLAEWREIEAVVPSPARWIELRADRGGRDITLTADQWTAIVRLGAGCTVSALGERLGLAELPAARVVRDLVQADAVTLSETDVEEGDAGGTSASGGAPVAPEPAATEVDPLPPLPISEPAPAPEAETAMAAPAASPAFAPAESAFAPAEPAPAPSFDAEATPPAPAAEEPLAAVAPLFGEPAPTPAPAVDLSESSGPTWDPGPASFDDDSASSFFDDDDEDDDDPLADDPFGPDPFRIPRLPNVGTDEDSSEAAEMARQLSSLSPRAAQAVAAAAAATSDEERDQALAQVSEESDEPLNRGLLLKFLSSVDE